MSSDSELISLISTGLYRIVSDELGPECIVKLRREKFDIFNVLMNCDPYIPNITIMSGSQAEGLEMKTSDFDIMFVSKDVAVLPSNFPPPERPPPQKSVLFYDTNFTSPGFVLLRCCFLDESNKHISNSLAWSSLGPLVCSKSFREYNLGVLPSTEIHGPCISGKNILFGEFDFACCLQCPYWPREASSFVSRSLRSCWPPEQVVIDICNDGCLFVPISCKLLRCQDAVEMEWRMSFSLAEKKLVYSMNHSQFLCYGLLKLFLNEVLKKHENINDLLCSYFMKTAVFWEITEDTSCWNAQNLLCKFWKTFRRLLSWMSVGYCPNFFNPNNNMFAGKIYGNKQRLLMETLRSFHNDGMVCLLRCPSLSFILTKYIQLTMIFRQPMCIQLSEELYVQQWYVAGKKIECVLFFSDASGSKLSRYFRKLCGIRNVTPTSTLMNAALKYGEKRWLQIIGETFLAELVKSNYIYVTNKAVKKYLQIVLNIFRRNATTFLASNLLAAKWFYILGMYHAAINVLRHTKTRLQSLQFMYRWAINKADFRRFRHPDVTSGSFLKSKIVNYVTIEKKTSITELILEHQAVTDDTSGRALFIPPTVFVNFLLLLSYHRLCDTIRRNDVLRDLYALLWFDDGYHIHYTQRAISWEILGICQQLCGDYHGAYQSYINALNIELNFFKMATIIRIVSLTNA